MFRKIHTLPTPSPYVITTPLCKARALTVVQIHDDEPFFHALYCVLSFYVYVMRLAGLISCPTFTILGDFSFSDTKKGGNNLTARVIRQEDGFSEGQRFGFYKINRLDKSRSLKL